MSVRLHLEPRGIAVSPLRQCASRTLSRAHTHLVYCIFFDIFDGLYRLLKEWIMEYSGIEILIFVIFASL